MKAYLYKIYFYSSLLSHTSKFNEFSQEIDECYIPCKEIYFNNKGFFFKGNNERMKKAKNIKEVKLSLKFIEALDNTVAMQEQLKKFREEEIVKFFKKRG